MALFTLDDWNGEKTLPFKDFMREDVSGVFLDLGEHAETHNVNGTDMPVILETDSLAVYSGRWESGAQQEFTAGLYTGGIRMYVSVADYGRRPATGGYIRLDGRSYKITGCSEEFGALYIITLEAMRQV